MEPKDLQKLGKRLLGNWWGYLGGFCALFILLQLLLSIHSVKSRKGLVVIKKWGTNAEWKPHQTSAAVIAKDGSHKGIQYETLGEGIHFLPPLLYDVHEVDQIIIKEGHVGVRVRLFGKDLPPGRILAGDGEKGILRDFYKPGRYLVNTLAEKVIIKKAAMVPAGHVGVQVRMAGTFDPNDTKDLTNDYIMLKDGLRGVLRDTKDAGTHYVNPYAIRIIPVDVRLRLLKMSAGTKVQFPSSDGFMITVEGEVPWRINPKDAPMAYVKFIDTKQSERDAIEKKLILPAARAISRITGSTKTAATFLDGGERTKFQGQFSEALKSECQAQHILIEEAKITDIKPPDEIATIIRQRYKLREELLAITQEIKAETQRVTYEKARVLQDREKALKGISAEMESLKTKALEEQQVAIIQAEQKLAVAKQQLIAAKFQVQAMKARADAKAAVIKQKNAAEAAGFAVSRQAFGSGELLAHYELMRKLAPSIRYILGNTEGEFSQIFREVFKNTLDGETSGAKKGGN